MNKLHMVPTFDLRSLSDFATAESKDVLQQDKDNRQSFLFKKINTDKLGQYIELVMSVYDRDANYKH